MQPLDFAVLLKQLIGLDATAIGSSLESALRERQRACGLENLACYWQRVQSDRQELDALIEAVVVPETCFFRHPEALVAMRQFMTRAVSDKSEKHARLTPAEPVRLLSLPCSTGEEPYSMAMALLAAGFAPGQFQIDAVDVSERALSKAKIACYGQNSFRGHSLEFRARYCNETSEGFTVQMAAREPVCFRRGNLLDANLPDRLGRYEVIFCRNLFIYFDHATQAKALATLASMLKPDGLLFVGPAETGLLLRHSWVPLGAPHAFAFFKPGIATATAPSRRPKIAAGSLHPGTGHQAGGRGSGDQQRTSGVKLKTKIVIPHPVTQPVTHPDGSSVLAGTNPSSVIAAQTPARVHTLLQQAQALADQGELAQAEKLCRQFTQTHAPNADAFYLLGLVNDASGRTGVANEHYRKALYLDPQHPEALIHLAVILEAQGDRAGAARLYDRAKRVNKTRRNPTHE